MTIQEQADELLKEAITLRDSYSSVHMFPSIVYDIKQLHKAFVKNPTQNNLSHIEYAVKHMRKTVGKLR